MKNNSTHKSTLLAIACFVALGFFAAHSANAQNDSSATSPLIATTGANVLGSGHLLLSGDVNATRFHSDYFHKDDSKHNIFGGGASLRWGIGSNAELTLGVSASHAEGYLFDTITYAPDNLNLVPSIGARIMLLGSEESKNKLTFFTEVTLPLRRGVCWPSLSSVYSTAAASPAIGTSTHRRPTPGTVTPPTPE